MLVEGAKKEGNKKYIQQTHSHTGRLVLLGPDKQRVLGVNVLIKGKGKHRIASKGVKPHRAPRVKGSTVVPPLSIAFHFFTSVQMVDA